MKFSVLIGRTDGILSSVGLKAGSLKLLHRDLAWIGKGEREAVIAQLIMLVDHLTAKGIPIAGSERLVELYRIAAWHESCKEGIMKRVFRVEATVDVEAEDLAGATSIVETALQVAGRGPGRFYVQVEDIRTYPAARVKRPGGQ